MLPDLFNRILEIAMRLAEKEESGTGVKIDDRPMDKFRFADSIGLLADTKENLQDLLNRVDNLQDLLNRVDKNSKRMGLKINGSAGVGAAMDSRQLLDSEYILL